MPDATRPHLQTAFSHDRCPQHKTLAVVIAAIVERTQATSVAVAGHVAIELGTPLSHALTRCLWRLRNPPIDEPLQLLSQGPRLLLALDWTA